MFSMNTGKIDNTMHPHCELNMEYLYSYFESDK